MVNNFSLRPVQRRWQFKLRFVFLLGGNETFPMEVQEDFLLTVCTKFLLYRLRFFPLLTVDTKNFYSNAEQNFTHGVNQKTFITTETDSFSAHGGYTKFFN